MSNDKFYNFRQEVLSIVLDENSYVPLEMIDKYILLSNESQCDKNTFVDDIITKIDDLNSKREALIKEKESLIKD